MRGWITGRNTTCGPQLGADDSLELVQCALEVVVDDRVLELGLERELPLGDLQPFVDLTLALRGPVAEPALEFLSARRGHKDDNAVGNPVTNRERPTRLDL